MPVRARAPAVLALALAAGLAVPPAARAQSNACPAGSVQAGGGGYQASGANQYDNTVVGNGQCAVFVEAATPGIGQVSTWQPGEQVQGASDIPIGTPIATFNFDGSYGDAATGQASGVSGESHTGLYEGQNAQGVLIKDQYVGKPVTTHLIPWSQWSGGTAEAGNKYYVVRNPNASSTPSPSSTPSSGSSGTASGSTPSTGSSASTASCTPTTAGTPTTETPASSTPSQSQAASPAQTGQGALTGTAQASPSAQPSSGTPSAVSAGQTGITLDLASHNPNDQAGTSDLTVGDPTVCWICTGAMYALGIVETVGAAAAPVVAQTLWPLAAIFAAIALIVGVGGAVVSGGDPLRPAMRLVARFALVGAVFAGGAIAPLGSSGGTILFDYVLGPPIEAGAAVGGGLADIASSTLGVNIPSGNCSYVDASTAKVSQLKDASTSLMGFMCKVHVAAATVMELGATMVTHSGDKSTQMNQATAVLISAVGCAVMFMGMMAMVHFGFAVIEVLIKVGMICAFFPVFAFAWLFEITRDMVRQLFDALLFTFLYLSLSGLSAVVAVYVMMEAFSFGLGQDGSSVSSSGLMGQFDSIASSMDLQSAQGLTKVALLSGFTLAGSSLSSRILRAAQELAVEVTGYAFGRSGELAAVGGKLVGMVSGMGSAAAGFATSFAGRSAGVLAGGATRRAGALVSRGGAAKAASAAVPEAAHARAASLASGVRS